VSTRAQNAESSIGIPSAGTKWYKIAKHGTARYVDSAGTRQSGTVKGAISALMDWVPAASIAVQKARIGSDLRPIIKCLNPLGQKRGALLAISLLVKNSGSHRKKLLRQSMRGLWDKKLISGPICPA